MDTVLISEPIGSLDGIVRMPSPCERFETSAMATRATLRLRTIILSHVPQGGVDSSLGGDGVGSSREEFRDAGGLQSGLGESKGGSESSSSSTNDDSIVLRKRTASARAKGGEMDDGKLTSCSMRGYLPEMVD